MPDGQSESLSAQLGAVVDQAEEIEATVGELLDQFAKFDHPPLISYDEVIETVTDEIQAHSTPLKLEQSDLKAAENQLQILQRVRIALDAQLTTQQKAVEQRVDYYEDRLELLADFAADCDASSSVDDDLKASERWIENTRRFIDRGNHAQLLDTGGTYNLRELQSRIEDTEADLSASAGDSEHQEYLHALGDTILDVCEQLLDRLKRVRSVVDQESQRVATLKASINEAESLDEVQSVLDEIQSYRSELETRANTVVEVALFLDALEEEFDLHPQQATLCAETREQLADGTVDAARKRVGKIVQWETELTPADRFEIALSEHDHDVLTVIEETEITFDTAMESIEQMYKENKIIELVVEFE